MTRIESFTLGKGGEYIYDYLRYGDKRLKWSRVILPSCVAWGMLKGLVESGMEEPHCVLSIEHKSFLNKGFVCVARGAYTYYTTSVFVYYHDCAFYLITTIVEKDD